MTSNFYSENELKIIGFKKIGKNVLISKKCSIYGDEIKIGNNVRIDDFCILSGNIEIGNYVHISAYCALYGKSKIKIGNYSGLSPRSTIFSASDDFSGNYMVGPMVPIKLTNVISGPVILEDYVQLGSNTIVMPNLIIGQGAITGAFTFVNKNIDNWTMNAGIPSKILKKRSKKILDLKDWIGKK